MTAPFIGYHAAHEQFTASELVRFAPMAEEAGFDGLWVTDHFHPWQDNQGHAGHAWITLAAIGQRTQRLLLGTGVTCPTYRFHPAEVAHGFATLAGLHPGRIFLGVGIGEAINEYPFAGYGPYRERAARLVEAIGLIRQLWSGEWVDFEGRYFRAKGAKLYDKPPQPIPIYVAAFGPKSARMAGEHGDGWVTNAEVLVWLPHCYEAFQEGARAASKDPSTMPRLAELIVIAGDRDEALEAARFWQFAAIPFEALGIPDPREVQRLAEERSSPEQIIPRWVVSPEPEAHIEAIRWLAEHGATHVFIHAPQPDQPRLIRFYGEHVIPAVKRG
jgi:TAT-translocated FGD2 family F420-dependent dehydrogenase